MRSRLKVPLARQESDSDQPPENGKLFGRLFKKPGDRQLTRSVGYREVGGL